MRMICGRDNSKKLLSILCLILLVSGFAAMGVDVERFPRPSFSVPHEFPVTTTPPPRANWLQVLDVGVLIFALSLTSYFALKRRSRRGILLMTMASVLYFGFWRKGCVCPIGSIQNVTQALFDSSYAIPLTVLAFFIIPIVFTLLFGRTFCAAVCPLGAVQDLVIFKPLKVPRPFTAFLGTIPYVYLGLAILLAATGIDYIICRLDPFVGFFRMSATFPMILLGTFLLGLGVFVARPYCRFLCPYGVILGWFSRFSKYHVTITPTECIHCRLCEDSCPFDAIEKPITEPIPEPVSRGAKRVAAILIVLPLAMFAGAWLGARLDVALSTLDIKIRIADRLVAENAGLVQGTNLDTDSFRSTGRQNAELFEETAALTRRVRKGGMIFGALAGLIFGARMIGLSLHKKRKDYEPNNVTCLSCARCFETCPKEHERLKKIGDSE